MRKRGKNIFMTFIRDIAIYKQSIMIPYEMKTYNQWALRKKKVPYQTNGDKASSTDSSTWTSYEKVANVLY